MALGVGIDTNGTCYGAGGVVFQPMPDAGEEEIAMVEAVLPRLTNVSALYRDMEAEEVMDEILGGGFYFEQPLSYHCQCSKDRFAAKLTTLGKQELENLIAQDGKIEVKCDFCQKTYTYYEKDVQSMTEKYER
jgi:molecular chaperone Hsp33